MALKIEVSCPNQHVLSASLNDMASASTLNIGADIQVEGKCPICGAGPMQALSGYYEADAIGVLKRTGDYRRY